MNCKKKLLYIMGIDWNWIFQRPQILALHLAESYQLSIVFPRSILNSCPKPDIRKKPKNSHILWTLPLQEKNRLIGAVSTWINRKIFNDIYLYDVVVIGYPLYYRYIPTDYSGKIIYDCMDNYEALYPDSKNKQKVIAQEASLTRRSNAIVTTGRKLYKKMEQIVPGKVFLIRNGTDIGCYPVLPKDICPARQQADTSERKYEIGYFGTIAGWFDYALLMESLKRFPDIEYRLIGPVLHMPEYTSDRLHLEGIVEHECLAEAMKICDCLIMPFIVNDVVEWVDPVKLYEYIGLGKCIICVRYEEVERFEDYAYLYNTHEDYFELLEYLKKINFKPKYTQKQQAEFLRENSWSDRFEKWDALLSNILETPGVG